MPYYILIKKKGSKRYQGIVPAKKKVSKAVLRKSLKRNLKKGLTFRIITKKELVKLLKNLKVRGR